MVTLYAKSMCMHTAASIVTTAKSQKLVMPIPPETTTSVELKLISFTIYCGFTIGDGMGTILLWQRMKLDMKSVWTICPSTIVFCHSPLLICHQKFLFLPNCPNDECAHAQTRTHNRNAT